MRAVYSATLFVAVPIVWASSTVGAPGRASTTAYAAGPGLPRAAPSMCMVAVSDMGNLGDEIEARVENDRDSSPVYAERNPPGLK
jgi:hypothetical protein